MPTVPACARKATSVRTAASGGVQMPAAAKDTARRGCASVKRASRALTAQQVGRGAPRGRWQGRSSQLVGGGKRYRRESEFRPKNCQMGRAPLLSERGDVLSRSQLTTWVEGEKSGNQKRSSLG